MIWIGVAIGDHPAELLVATAAVKLIELHDVALQAKRDGSTFDPAEDDVETIYHRYALRRRLGDRRRCYWLSALTGVSREDFDAARVSLGPFAYNLEVVDDELAPCVHDVGDLTMEVVDAFAEEMGCALPSDAHERVRRLVRKHAPKPATRASDSGSWTERFAQVMSIGHDAYALVEEQGVAAMGESEGEGEEAAEARLARRAAKRRRLTTASVTRV